MSSAHHRSTLCQRVCSSPLNRSESSWYLVCPNDRDGDVTCLTRIHVSNNAVLPRVSASSSQVRNPYPSLLSLTSTGDLTHDCKNWPDQTPRFSVRTYFSVW